MKKGIILYLACLLLSCLLTIPALAGTTSYEYNDLHRLTKVTRDDGSVTVYDYDELGDRKSVTTVIDTSTPTPLFTANYTSGTAPLTVIFTDQSTGTVTSWEWDFDNDGLIDSNVQHPTHAYDKPGTYSVTLKVSGTGDPYPLTKPNYINVYYYKISPVRNFDLYPYPK
jgi:YD repeat-containing protein